MTVMPAGLRAEPATLRAAIAPAAGRDPATSRVARAAALGLAAILLLAFVLRVFGIAHYGFTTPYYAAAVRSMAGDWRDFLFAAFDPAGFLAVDKPPVALWAQVASVRLLGFGALALHLPQALEGVAAVGLLYHLVRRRFGRGAALLAALFLALMPLNVAIDRSNNTDSCLVLVMLLAAWPLSLAAERGRLSLLLLAAAILGVGFNVKMFAALVVVPGFIAVYWLGAPVGWGRRLGHLLAAAAVLAAVSLSWPLAVDFTPAGQRPYVDSTQDNSELELAIGHNAMDRFIRPAWRRGEMRRAAAQGAMQAGAQGAGQPDGTGRQRALPRPVGGVPAGPFRLADPLLASQVGWLVPLAAAGLLFGFGLPRRNGRWFARRPGGWLPLAPDRQALLVWGLWIVISSAAYSAAGGIFQPYYLAPLGPPVAALSGIAVMRLRTLGRIMTALLVTAAWQAAIVWGSLPPDNPLMWLGLVPLVAAAAVGATLMVRRRGGRPALALGVAALALAPAAWSIGTAIGPAYGSAPRAHLLEARYASAARARADALADDGKLLAFLTAHRGGARYLVATPNARQAAPLILRTGAPVLALGGFLGSVPILTPAGLSDLARSGQLRWVMVTADRPAGPASAALREWVRAHGCEVPPDEWRDEDSEELLPRGPRAPNDPAGLQLYDIAPAASADPA